MPDSDSTAPEPRISLRGGAETRDPRLDRVKHFDPRSRNFPIRETRAVEGKRPRSYAWNFASGFQGLDQGRSGSCVGFGWAHELAARPAKVPGMTNQFAKEKIYWQAQKRDPWDGGSYPDASPNYEGTAVIAGAQVVQKELGLISEYRWAFGLNDVILALGYAGPVVLGLDWFEQMMNADSGGFIHPKGDYVGGHCILARGVDVKRKRVLLRNSWGRWGYKDSGDCYISFDDLAFLLNRDGEACVPSGRKVAA
ncbi:MAG: hypothetical protein ACR2M4_06450 [Actinomycetota bacterium]